ncbi:SLATT domain-containing protein [Pantoea dispersa]|uniref:SLATT domain-containing protein n=1 Tax=Pantoea dispersa TaxID=59814 RepID=UPI0039B542CD
MSGDSARAVLLSMVSNKITPLKRKCRANKRRFQWLTAGSIIFSAAITLTLGLDLPENVSEQKNTALLFGMALTLINGWLAIFDYKKLWIRQKSTLFGLYQLENELNFLSESPQDQERVEILFKSYQTLWEKDGNEWSNIQNTSAPDNN